MIMNVVVRWPDISVIRIKNKDTSIVAACTRSTQPTIRKLPAHWQSKNACNWNIIVQPHMLFSGFFDFYVCFETSSVLAWFYERGGNSCGAEPREYRDRLKCGPQVW